MTATVREIDGQLVLEDPMAVAMARVVQKHNCRTTMELNLERVEHFKTRIQALGKTPEEVVITLINVDTVAGGALAIMLMPGTDWSSFWDRGETPFARGLAGREGITEFLREVDPEAAEKLVEMGNQIAVVVVDYDVAEIFPA